MDTEQETIQLRIHGAASLPALVYLPGLHGDWTLVSSFRAAIRDRMRFVEFTYPRTVEWTLKDYAGAVIESLERSGICSAWLLAESFSSQVAWQILEMTTGKEKRAFIPRGVILAGGFARYPIFSMVRCARAINRLMPAWMMRAALWGYSRYARFRHRQAPETLESIHEFVARRTEPDRQAILHRYGLILSSRAEETARHCSLPVYALCGFVDPVVPWVAVLPWLRRHCPGFRGSRIIFNADHNVLGTAPRKSADQIVRWIASDSGR